MGRTQRGFWLNGWRLVKSATALAGVAALGTACGRTARNDDFSAGTGGASTVSKLTPDCAVVLAGQDYGYCAVYRDGSLWCWGPGGAVSPQNFVPSSEPLQVDVYGLKALTLGARHACGIDARDQLWCWGNNEHGQIDPSNVTPLAPQEVELVSEAPLMGVGLGEAQTCAIDTLSQVYCWGRDESGRVSTPVPVGATWGAEATMPNGTPEVFDEHGRVHDIRTWAEPRLRSQLGLANSWFGDAYPQSCLLKRSGSLWCSNYITDDKDDALRVKTKLAETVVQAVVGEMFTCALNADGKVWCEGLNSLGQAGTGANETFTNGAFVAGLSNVRAVAAAQASACALDADGNVWCWGAYAKDRSSNQPVRVSGCTSPTLALPAPLAPLSVSDAAARLGEAGQARGEALCSCAYEGVTQESIDQCALAESFAPNGACLAALDPHDTAYYNCRADNLWAEASCFAGRACTGDNPLGNINDCPVQLNCGEAAHPAVQRFCRLWSACPSEPNNFTKERTCNGIKDCADGADELNCTPGARLFKCTDGGDGGVGKLCDGAADCADGSDEDRCF